MRATAGEVRTRRVAALAVAALALALALPAATGCGYHVVSAAHGPAGDRPVAVLAVDAARAVDARLASALAEALPLELARSGVVVAPVGRPGSARLHATVEPLVEEAEVFPRAPDGVEAPSVTGRIAGSYALWARVRVRLEDDAGAMLWDGTVTARETLPESASLADREASRERAERSLAVALAERVREVLVR